MSTLWQNKMRAEPASDMLKFTVSVDFDVELAEADITSSQAHVMGLKKAKLIDKDELQALLAALKEVGEEFKEKNFSFVPTDEDVHTAIERRVTEKIGQVGAKLHTGRSRNDQVVTAYRLWMKAKLTSILQQILVLQKVLLERAKEVGDATLPGYTHFQRAQPVYLAEHLLAHGWAFSRDISRIEDTIERMNVSPLGAGALAGSSLGLDPEYTAGLLGFAREFENSLDAVSDRDFVVEALSNFALLGVHLSRIAEEIILWSSAEIGFMDLPEAWSTGSSMLPQKKNPDIAELIRGKTGRLIGNLTGFLATLKGLPLAYNRDLQEDKEPVFDSADTIQLGMAALSGLLSECTFNLKAMAESAQAPEMSATALAEYLVREKGVPFRKAHEQVGVLVHRWQENGRQMDETDIKKIAAVKKIVADELGEEAAAIIPAKPNGDFAVSVKRFDTYIQRIKIS